MSIGFTSFHLQYLKLVSFHSKSEQLSYFANGHSPNVYTITSRQLVFRQYLPFSWTTLRGKHCRQPIAVMALVVSFGHNAERKKMGKILENRLHQKKSMMKRCCQNRN